MGLGAPGTHPPGPREPGLTANLRHHRAMNALGDDPRVARDTDGDQ